MCSAKRLTIYVTRITFVTERDIVPFNGTDTETIRGRES